MTAPRSRAATTGISSVIAGIPPVSPAAMTGSRGWRSAPDRRLLRQQAVAPIGRVERTLSGEDAGPGLRQNFEKMRARSANARQDRPARDRQAARSSLPRSPRCREGARGWRRERRPGPAAADRGRAACPIPAPVGSTADGAAIPGSPAALHRLPSSAAPSTKDSSSEIEVADRPHPRQQQRRAGVSPIGQDAQKSLAQSADRTPGRQQNGDPRQRQRIIAGDGEQPLGQGRQKRAVGRDRVELGLHGGSRPRMASARCGADDRRSRVASSPAGVPM